MAYMIAPKPTPVVERPYKFSVVKEFLDLEKQVKKNRKDGSPDIRVDPNFDFLQPDLKPGKDGHKKAFEDLVKKNGGPSQCRLLYITRHGESEHNVINSQRGKKESFACLGHFDAEKDPKLTNTGKSQADKIGSQIRNSGAAKYALPKETHSSSLFRCVQTSAFSAANYLPQGDPINIITSDDWREWMGSGMFHVSDARSTKSTLATRIRDMKKEFPGDRKKIAKNNSMPAIQRNIDVNLDSLTEQDVGFKVSETFVNVDIRLERALAKLYQKDITKNCFHIVTHGRTTQSLLRLLGFERDASWEKIEKYRVWDFANCGTIALLVRCEPRSAADMKTQLKKDGKLQMEEYSFANAKYERDVDAGFLAIQQDPEKWKPEIPRLKKELKHNPDVKPRLDHLEEACARKYRPGSFRVKPSWKV